MGHIVTHKPGISELHVTFSYNFKLSHEQIKILLLSVPYKQIQNLNLNLSFCVGLADVDLELISVMLKCIPNLKYLAIEQNNWNNNLTPSGYRHLAKALKVSCSLEELKLRLNLGLQPQKSFAQLMESLKYLSGLKKLNLEFFTDEDFNDQGIRIFAESIQRHERLTELRLFIPKCPELKDDSVNSLANSLHRLVNLEKLKLDLPGTEMTLAGFNKVTTAVQQLKFLKVLELNLPGSQFGPNNASSELQAQNVSEIIIKTIKQLPLLTSLKISLLAIQVGDDRNYQKILASIAGLSQLSALGLCLHDTSMITDKSISAFADVIQGLPLRLLEFNLGEVNELSKESWSKLVWAIKSRQELRECRIEIENFPIDDETRDADLFASIGDLYLLTKLSLTVSGSVISNDSLKLLGESLGNIKHLEKLTIVLYSCEQVDDNGIGYLTTKLKDLHSLTELTLHFMLLTQATNNALGSLSSSLANLHELTRVNLWLNSTEITSEELNEFAEQLDSKLEKLKEITLA